MERKVIHRDYQEMTSGDLNNMQTFTQDVLDRLVVDAIGPGLYFTGFEHQATDTWELTLSAGRFFQDGRMYRRASSSVLNLYNSRPLVNKKIVAVTAWGQTIETDVQPRDFLINVDTGETQPDAVAMESLRSAEVATIAGAEAPQPTAPQTAANNVLIALVTLGTGGIEQVQRIEDNVLPQVLRNLIALKEIAVWRAGVGTAIDTIRTDLASLAIRFEDYVRHEEFDALRDAVALIKAMAEEALTLAKNAAAPATIYRFLDSFNDASQSDEEAIGYAALIENGALTFPFAASDTSELALVNANDPKVKVTNNMMSPVATQHSRIDTSAGTDGGTADMLAYTTATHTYKTVQKKNPAYRAGKSEYIYRSIQGVPGVTFNANNFSSGQIPKKIVVGSKTYEWTRYDEDGAGSGKWKLTYVYRGAPTGEQYIFVEEEVVSTSNHTAQARAQVWLNANPGYLVKTQLELAARAGTGDIIAQLVECDGGEPNLDRVLASVTVAYADLVDGLNDFLFPPTYCAPGRRYAVVYFSSGNHKIRLRTGTRGVTKGNSYALESANKWIIPGEIAEKDLSVKLFFGSYASSRVEVDLQPLELAGGIEDIKISAPMITPPGTQLWFEGYVDGVWYPLSETSGSRDTFDWSAAARSVIQLRAVFLGTVDLMPSLGIGNLSNVTVSRRATTLKHVSEARDVGAAKTVTKAQVKVVVENWDAANTLTLSLVVAGAPEAADSVSDVEIGGRLVRTAHFTFYANRHFTPVIDATLGAGKAPMVITERLDTAS